MSEDLKTRVEDLERALRTVRRNDEARKQSRRKGLFLGGLALALSIIAVPAISYSLDPVPNPPSANEPIVAAEVQENFNHFVDAISALEEEATSLVDAVNRLEQSVCVPLVARYSRGGTSAFGLNDPAVMNFQTRRIDTEDSVSAGSDWVFTSPRTAHYQVSAAVQVSEQNLETSRAFQIYIVVDGVEYSESTIWAAQGARFPTVQIDDIVELSSGQQLDIRIRQVGGTEPLGTTASENANFVSLQQICEPGALL